MPNATIHDIPERIEAARRFRSETCGGEPITSDLFGDDRDYATRGEKSGYVHAGLTPEIVRARMIRQIGVRKRMGGGIIGVTKVHATRSPRWQVETPDRRIQLPCAIEAAIMRNETYEAAYSGVVEFKCDMNAVWKKWGCACGKHSRGQP